MYNFKSNFFNSNLIAKSGQAFRITPMDSKHTELIAFGKYLQIADLGNNEYALSCDEDEFENLWKHYFDLETDYNKIIKEIDDNDKYLIDAMEFGRGIRILNQEIFETTISYIISQRRSIPSITTSVNRLSKLCGKKIVAPTLPEPFIQPLNKEYYAFPTPDELGTLSIDQIKDTGVGYRAEYIYEATNDFKSGKLSDELLNNLSDDDLYTALTNMYGVGKKVANCIMLFAFHRTGRFPIDVWIERIVNKYYDGKFDTDRYPDTAGIMQQFMFYYERNR